MKEEDQRQSDDAAKQVDNESNDESSNIDSLSEKDRKKLEDRKNLLNRVVSGKISTIKEKVAFILNNYPDTRNSDVYLAWQYWKVFESDKFNGKNLTRKDLLALTRQSSLARMRAKIQNEYKLFEADIKVRRYRGVLEEEEKNKAIDEKPEGLPIYQVYMDETGKTQAFLTVGSLWVTDGYSTLQTFNEIAKWKEENSVKYEFHFNKVTPAKLDTYKHFFELFLSLNPTVGFKAIIVSNKGLDTNQAITDLTFHTLSKGIKHEHDSGRAPLPRRLEIFLDDEEEGSDKIKLENIKERLENMKLDGLYLGAFEVVDSETSAYIQAVDLFVASLNRKLHNPDSRDKPKDILATHILDLLSFDINGIERTNTIVDKAEVFNLANI